MISTQDLRWVARQMDGVSQGWGALLDDALDAGDERAVQKALDVLARVARHHIRRRADRLDDRLGVRR